MNWLTGGWVHLGAVAGKAVLMYATALLALRVGERRTLAQWTIIDFATAVAMGAIIGRTAVAGTQSYVTGAVAVVTLVAVHRLVSALRFTRPVGKLVDHRVRVLVAHGRIREKELRRCALTGNDFAAHLRQRGVFSVEGLRYVLYEAKGDLTIVPEAGGDGRASRSDDDLVAAGLENAAGYP
jgi:uncharacterized membrane protein YcaP (DUF421 family)